MIAEDLSKSRGSCPLDDLVLLPLTTLIVQSVNSLQQLVTNELN